MTRGKAQLLQSQSRGFGLRLEPDNPKLRQETMAAAALVVKATGNVLLAREGMRQHLASHGYTFAVSVRQGTVPVDFYEPGAGPLERLRGWWWCRRLRGWSWWWRLWQ